MSLRIRHYDLYWLPVLALTILINVPLLSSRLVFIHDTLEHSLYFHFAYSELYFHGDLPMWIPSTAYGLPADFSMFCQMAPTDYPVMAAGWLLGVKDALLLFKVSMILRQCLFALGLYLLCRRLCTSLIAVYLVCAGALLTNSWLHNCLLNFTIFYLLPLVLYLLLRFLDGGPVRDLWLAGIVAGLSLHGTIAYLAPLHLLILAAFVVPFVAHDPRLLLRFVHWRNFVHPLFFVFVGQMLLLGTLIFGMDTVLLSEGRDPATGNLPLDDFLTFHRRTLSDMFSALIYGNVPHQDMTNFIGLLPLLMLGYGLVRRRDVPFQALVSVALVLFWFSLGGWFSTAAYYAVPLMNKFRQITIAFNILKVFLLILGGLGFDQMLRDLGPRQESACVSRRFSWRAWALAAVLLVFLADFWMHFGKTSPLDAPLYEEANSFFRRWNRVDILMARLLMYFLVFVAVIACVVKRRSKPAQLARFWIGPALLLAYLADVGLFYGVMVSQAPLVGTGVDTTGAFNVEPFEYAEERMLELQPPTLPDRVRRLIWIAEPQRGQVGTWSTYASLYLFWRVDVVAPVPPFRFRLDQISPGVKEMIEARGGKVEQAIVIPKQVVDSDKPFLRSLGLGFPRIHMVHEAVIADDAGDARMKFAALPNPDKVIVLIKNHPLGSEYLTQGLEPARVDFFSANRQVIEVTAKSPGWLFCADAYDPGWRATVNGLPADVLRANLGCKAVWVEPGPNRVVFTFDRGGRFFLRCAVFLFVGLSGVVLVGSVLCRSSRSWIRQNSVPPREG